jgi:hypothetical protein
MPRTRAVHALAAIDTATIHAELRRRRGLSARLAAMRDRLQAKVVRVEAQIADLGGTPNGDTPTRPGRDSGGRPGRGPRGTSLADLLAGAVKGRTVTVTEAVAAAQAAGYRSRAKGKGFYHAVYIALAQSGRFRRVGRGKYRAR